MLKPLTRRASAATKNEIKMVYWCASSAMALTLLFAGRASAQPFNDTLVQPATIERPSVGSIVGSLAKANFGPADLARGVQSLPSPIDFPAERGGELVQIAPTYSPEAGQSEWGMGWSNDHVIRRARLEGDIDYLTDGFTSPWGRLVQGTDGAWYPLGFAERIRLTLDATGWSGVAGDGTRYAFAERQDTASGTYAWYLTQVDGHDGSAASLSWTSNPSGARFLQYVTFGGVGQVDGQRVTVVYETIALPFVSYVSGAAMVMDQRVDRIESATKHAGTGAYTLRWTHDLEYVQSPLSQAFFLDRVTKTFASGVSEPPTTYTYDFGDVTIDDASFERAVQIEPYLVAAGGIAMQPTHAATLDFEEDGRLDFEHHYAFSLVHHTDAGWTSEALPPNPSADPRCRPADSVNNDPRLLARMRPDSAQPHVVFANHVVASASTQILLCERDGTPVYQGAFSGAWEPSATTRLVDLDRDRRPDFVRLMSGAYQVLENTSSSNAFSFAPRTTRALTPSFIADAAWVQDINGDGILDLVGRHAGGMVVWHGRGHFEFETQGVTMGFTTRSGQPLSGVSTFGANFLDVNRDGLTDVLLTRSTSAFLFVNYGNTFVERVVPALSAVGIDMSNPVLADVRGTGDVELVYTIGMQAWSLPLSTARTGLLRSADDGRGNRLRFGYGYASAEAHVPTRSVVLTDVHFETGGFDAVSHHYEYADATSHSVARHLLAFGLVRRSAPDVVEEIRFVAADDIPPAIVASTTSDLQTAGLVRFVDHDYDVRTHLGIRWRRSRERTHGWRPVPSGTAVEERSEVVQYQREWCPTTVRLTSMHGVLTESRTLATISGLVDALHCMPSRVDVVGTHLDPNLDFAEAQIVHRNALGFVDRVERDGPNGVLVQQIVGYDASNRVVSVSAPGRGSTSIDYHPVTGVVVGTTAPEGVRTTVDDINVVTGGIRAIRVDRGASGVHTSYFRYDGFERLERSWDDFGGSSQTTPSQRFEYVWPTASNAGVIELNALVDAVAGTYQRTAEVFAADGTRLGNATSIPQGWAISELTATSREYGITKNYVRGPLAPSALPSIPYGDLYQSADVYSSQHHAGFGHDAVSTVTTQGSNARRLDTTLSVASGLLVRAVDENAAYGTTAGEDAMGRVVYRIDEHGHRIEIAYDAMGRIAGVGLPDGTRHTVRYDGYGRGERIERQGVGDVVYIYGSSNGLLTQKRFYDTRGALVRTVGFEFDAIGRATREVHGDGANKQKYTFEFEYDGHPTANPGQRGYATVVTGPGFERHVVRNPDGSVQRTVVSIGGWRKVEVTSTYYANGALESTTRIVGDVANARILETVVQAYGYDTYGRLSTMDVNGVRAFTLEYDGEGRMWRADFGGQQDLVFSFDQPTRQPNGFWLDAGARVSGVSWYVDDRGHVREEVTSGGGRNSIRGYTYDRRGFLTEVRGGAATERYRYDNSGLVDELEDATGRRTLKRNGSTLTTGSATYKFDDAGRIVAHDGADFTYGPHGHIASAKVPAAGGGTDVVRYEYDELGQRILKTRNGRPEAGYLFGGYIDGTTMMEPVQIGGRLIGVIDGGRFELLHSDSRGSLLADRTGGANEVSAYGTRTTRTSFFAAFDFVERGYDADLGTVRMGSRDYDPKLGRFWTPDPRLLEQVDECAARPAECNLYGYAANNPIALFDPTGHASKAVEVLKGIVTRSLQVAAHDDMSYVVLGPAGPIAMEVVTRYVPAPVRALDQDPNAGTLERLIPTNQVAASLIAADNSSGFEQGMHIADTLMGVKETIELALVIRGLGQVAKKAPKLLRELGKKGRAPRCTGCKPSGKCFVAGTAVATEDGGVPIERIDVGDRVLTDAECVGTEVDPNTWAIFELELDNPDGSADILMIRTLRPLDGFAGQWIGEGDVVDIQMPELEIAGPATVVRIEATPKLSTDEGCLVLSTVTHLNGYVMQLTFEDSKEILEPTRHHRLFSYDAQDWVAAGAVRTGERLATSDGFVTVESVRPKPGVHRVYNLEVETRHAYFASSLEVLSHNTGLCDEGATLVRFGEGPESASDLAKAAAQAEAKNFPHGVSTKLVKGVKGSDKAHRSASAKDVLEEFVVEQTGRRKSHHTVHLPKPVTEKVAEAFNRLFNPK